MFPRLCPVCGKPSVSVQWRSEHLKDLTLVCSSCGLEGDTAALLQERDLADLLQDLRSEEVAEPATGQTKKQVAREMQITPQTLNRHIQQDGLKTHAADGAAYVHADQLREIWRRKRVRNAHPQRST